jgi:hypothetical protein
MTAAADLFIDSGTFLLWGEIECKWQFTELTDWIGFALMVIIPRVILTIL